MPNANTRLSGEKARSQAFPGGLVLESSISSLQFQTLTVPSELLVARTESSEEKASAKTLPR